MRTKPMPALAEIYPHQVEYLMSLYSMDRAELLDELNRGRKRLLTEKDVFAKRVKYSTVAALDRVFRHGQWIYFDRDRYDTSPQESILFRKPARLNHLRLPDKQLVFKMEGRADALKDLCTHADPMITEKLPKFKVSRSPATAAIRIRQLLAPTPKPSDKLFLAHLIDLLAENGVVVFEHVDLSLKKERQTNLAGFFIRPRYIAIVRNMLSYKSEIFTLLHELGHYLLQKEGFDLGMNDHGSLPEDSLSAEERWCDDFAFSFLAGEMDGFKDLAPDQASRIDKIANDLHLSKLAIHRQMYKEKKMTSKQYREKRRRVIMDSFKAYELKYGNAGPIHVSPDRPRMPIYQRPIYSKLEKYIFAEAFFSGAVDENVLLKRFQTNDLEGILNVW